MHRMIHNKNSQQKMLSFDIETEGLDSRKHRITVASIYDPHRSIQHTYNFIDTDDEQQVECRIKEFLQQLDNAPALCCFNGVKFDVPFIAKRFNVSPLRVHAWMLKLFDIFEICRLVYGSSCSLNALLIANGSKDIKSGSGLQAVEWANQKKWQLLEEYCMKDTVLTHEISAKSRVVKLPLSSSQYKGKNDVASFEHVYCPVSNEHKTLDFFG